jgi:hypothetical protein
MILVCRRCGAVALLALLVCAVPAAEAQTVYWGSGFDIGCAGNLTTCDGVALDATTSQHLFDSVVGSPTFSTTVDTAASANNRYSLQITAGNNATQYVTVPAFTALTSVRLGCKIRVTQTGNGCKREVASFVGSGGAWSGKAAIVAMRAAFQDRTTGVRYYTLEAYYGAKDQLVCSGSTANGKVCTTVTDCPEIHPGEAQCAGSTIAISPAIAAGDWASFTLTQDNATGGLGNVTVGLYEGTAGLTPAVYNRGSAIRRVGACSSGSNLGGQCDVASDCPGGVCQRNVVAPTTVQLGVSDTTACAVAYQLDDCWVYDGTVRANVRFETLTPNGTGTGTNEWEDKAAGTTNIYTSIDESERAGTGPANDATDYVTSGAGLAQKRQTFALSNIPKPSTSPTPVAVLFSGIAQKNWSTAGRTFDWRFEETDGIDELPHITYQINDLTNWPDDGATADYHPLWVEMFVDHPSGNKWTTKGLTDIDALQMQFDRVTASNTSQELRITSAIAEVVVQHADPPVPTHIADRDQDGEDTVCIVGDSTWDNQDFQNRIVASLVEPTNIYFYTRGGSQIGDAAAEWTQLLEGASGTYLGVDVKRGTAGRTCDIVFVSHTDNFVHPGVSLVDPKLPTALLGVGQAGYCEDQGGANQGAACWCATRNPLTSNAGSPGPNTTPGYLYCLNAGNFMKTPGAQGAGCACAVNADCTHGRRTPGALHTPGVCVTASPPAICEGHVANPGVDAPPSTRDSWMVPGCLGATGCSNGVCVRFPIRTELRQVMADLDAATAARPTPNPAATPAGTSGKPIIVWVIAPQAMRGSLTQSLAWDQSYPGTDMVRNVFRSYATATGDYVIDLHARMRKSFTDRMCATPNSCTTDEDQQLYLRDYVHWTAAGQREAAAAITDCLVTGGSDGVCTGSTCTVGLIGDTCAANADCDTQRCP